MNPMAPTCHRSDFNSWFCLKCFVPSLWKCQMAKLVNYFIDKRLQSNLLNRNVIYWVDVSFLNTLLSLIPGWPPVYRRRVKPRQTKPWGVKILEQNKPIAKSRSAGDTNSTDLRSTRSCWDTVRGDNGDKFLPSAVGASPLWPPTFAGGLD